jgi:hypothetical protein
MKYLPSVLNKNINTINCLVGAGSPRKLNNKSLNGKATGDIKPALFANQFGITSNDAKRAGYKFISKRTTMVPYCQSMNEPAPTLININGCDFYGCLYEN